MRLALLEGLAVQALLHQAQGDGAAATRVLRESLDMAAPEGIVQRYAYLGPALVPILRRLLAERTPHPHARACWPHWKPCSPPSRMRTVTPKSPTATGCQPAHRRETRGAAPPGLRLTNNEIGEELFISPITVKHHVAHITDKLGVSGRRAAVERASELGLLRAAS